MLLLLGNYGNGAELMIFYFYFFVFYAIDEVEKWVLSDFYTCILCLFQQRMSVQC